MWKILDTGVASAAVNMRLDYELLKNLESSKEPIIHLYSWREDSLTYGYFTNLADFLNLEFVKKYNFDCAKRPTGGGIIFHLTDLAFSVLIPAKHSFFSSNTMENYAFVNQHVIQAVEAITGKLDATKLLAQEPKAFDQASQFFCMAKPTKFDVVIGDLKIGGAAQRRTKAGLLHQGSISIAKMPKQILQDVLKKNTKVFEAMEANSYTLLKEDWTQAQLIEMRRELCQQLLASFMLKI